MRNLVLAFVIALFVGSAAQAALIEVILDHGYSDGAGNNFQVLIKVNPANGERGVTGMGIRLNAALAYDSLTVTSPQGGLGAATPTNKAGINTNRAIQTAGTQRLITGTQDTTITDYSLRYIGFGVVPVELNAGKQPTDPEIVGVPMQVAVGKDTLRNRNVTATTADAWKQWFYSGGTATTANSGVTLMLATDATQTKYATNTNIDNANGITYYVIPEPASLALMGLGGLVLAFRRR